MSDSMYSSSSRSQAFHYPSSSRSRPYPSFLSIVETLLLQWTWAWRGVFDSFRWDIVVFTVASDSEIRANLYKSLLLNSLSLMSIYTFDLLLLPLVREQEKWLPRNLGWFYQISWLLPVVGVSFWLNSSWCSIIAKRTYTLLHGNRAMVQQQPVTYTGLLTAIATSAYRIVMVFTSVLVSFSLASVPYIGNVAGFVFLCWVDSYYCFEFVWIARGLSLSRRIRHLEERWSYYFAFGLPSAALCTWGTGLANAAVFALVFPVYIIMAMHAHPVPLDPYNPVAPIPSARAGENDVIRHPSPFVPIRLPIFALVMWLNDAFVRLLNTGGGVSNSRTRTFARNRTLSQSMEGVEDGIGMELHSLPRSSSPSRKPLRSVKGRINIGRRKAD